ncbi:MAG: hypothetical protein J7M20_08170 [Deltaproteobacteria bacterium]|nr:hypothetical protein [Deltaproteobacteria bacterium]
MIRVLTEKLLFGCPHGIGKHVHIPGFAFRNILSEVEEIDGILTRDPLGIEGTVAQESFSAHIGRQPVPVVVLGVIPEEFFLGTDTVNGFNQAAGKQVGKGPYDLVNFFVQQFKIGIGLMFLGWWASAAPEPGTLPILSLRTFRPS